MSDFDIKLKGGLIFIAKYRVIKIIIEILSFSLLDVVAQANASVGPAESEGIVERDSNAVFPRTRSVHHVVQGRRKLFLHFLQIQRRRNEPVFAGQHRRYT